MNLIFHQGSRRTVPNRSVPVPDNTSHPQPTGKKKRKDPEEDNGRGWFWSWLGKVHFYFLLFSSLSARQRWVLRYWIAFQCPPFVHSRALCCSCRAWADTWTGCNGGQRTAAVQLAGLSLAVWWDDGKKHPRLQKRLNGGRTKGNYGIIIIARHPLSNTLSQPPAIPALLLLLPL